MRLNALSAAVSERALSSTHRLVFRPPAPIGSLAWTNPPPNSGSSGCPPKSVKDRTHLDDIERTAAQLIALGAEQLPQDDFREFNVVFRVMLDPEGTSSAW